MDEGVPGLTDVTAGRAIIESSPAIREGEYAEGMGGKETAKKTFNEEEMNRQTFREWKIESP